MKTLFLVAALLIAPVVAAQNVEPPSLVKKGAFIKCGESQGSGGIFVNTDVNFILTNAHVVSEARVVELGLCPTTGKPKVLVSYKDVWVGQEEFEGGRKVGEDWKMAKVIRFSESQDIAILMVYKRGWKKEGITLLEDGVLPKVGDDVTHIGSPRGYSGFNSLLAGKIARVGLIINNRPLVYEQVGLLATLGCSGGPVFDGAGKKCLGIVRGFLGEHAPGTTIVIPARRIREFASRTNCLWVFDGSVAIPKDLGVVTDGVVPFPKGVKIELEGEGK